MRGLVVLSLLSLAAWGRTPQWARAHELYQRTEYVQAISVLNGAPSKGTDEWQLIGQCHFMQGDFGKATDAFEKALALDPRNSELHRWLGNTYGRRAETGSVFTAPGNARKARQYFERAVELDPNNREAVANLFEYYLEAPGFLGGGMDKAESLIRNIGKLSPTAALHAEAQLESKRKRYDLAETQLRKAAQLAPQEAGRLVDLAKFLADRGRVKESDEEFREAAHLDPDNPQVLFARAETYIRQKRNLKDARELLRRYLASPLTPDDPPRESAAALLKQTGN
jgi:Flp pilus assembly protein TadD